MKRALNIETETVWGKEITQKINSKKKKCTEGRFAGRVKASEVKIGGAE